MGTYKEKIKTGYVTKFSNADGRPNKLSQGLTRHLERNKSLGKDKIINDDVCKLSVKGTLDILSSVAFNYYVKWTMKEHPIDKGYFKRVLVLNDSGKLKLKRLKTSQQCQH